MSRKDSLAKRVWRATRVLLGVLLCLGVAEVLVATQGLAPAPPDGGMRADLDLLWLPPGGDPRELSFGISDNDVHSRTAVAVGDSSVYGFGVPEGMDFVNTLEQLSQGRVRTLNCAVPGYSSYQSLAILKEVVPREKPDLVIIGNLWSDNVYDSFIDKELIARRNGTVARVAFHLNKALGASALWRWLLAQSGANKATHVHWGRKWKNQGGERRVAVNDYAANLLAMVDLAESQGAEVLFVLLANEDDILEPGLPQGWTLYRKVMRDVAAARGYPVVEVPALFRKTGLGCEDLFVDQMHPSRKGHALIAGAILKALNDRRWLAGAALSGAKSGAAVGPYIDRNESVEAGDRPPPIRTKTGRLTSADSRRAVVFEP